MYEFNRVFLETKPLRIELETAEKIVETKMAIVAEKKALLAKVTAKL